MPGRWTVLGSGSTGNASLLQVDGFGLMIDAGLGPRQTASRLKPLGLGWQHVHAVLLTHTHGDHWHERTLAHLREREIPFYCHGDHVRSMLLACPSFTGLRFARLVRTYAADRVFEPVTGLRCRPFAVAHDGGPTFGFRFEGPADLVGPAWAVAYAADLGSWDARVVQALCDVDLLALEFNHDPALQRASGRAPWLIQRILGDSGHLSNAQAAALLAACLEKSSSSRLQHLVQLHLSRDCNEPALAEDCAREVVRRLGLEIAIHTARHDAATAPIEVMSR